MTRITHFMRRYWKARLKGWLKPQPTSGMGFGRRTFEPPQTEWWQQLRRMGFAAALVLAASPTWAGDGWTNGNGLQGGAGLSANAYRGTMPGGGPGNWCCGQVPNVGTNPGSSAGFWGRQFQAIRSYFGWQSTGWYSYDRSHESPGSFRAEPGPTGY